MGVYRDEIESATRLLLSEGWSIEKVSEREDVFGNTELVLARNDIRVRFVSDRGQYLVDAKERAGRWYDIKNLLSASGVEIPGGPFAHPRDAVTLIQNWLAKIEETLADPERLERIVKDNDRFFRELLRPRTK
jgi:hypothetical protein